MRILTIILLFFGLCFSAIGQDKIEQLKPDDYVSVLLKEGTEIKGTLKLNNETTIVIETNSLGTLTIMKTQIQSVDVMDEEEYFQKGKYEFDNPLPNKNYLTETAIGLEKGEGFYQNVLLGGHFFSYGFTDNFSLSGGFETFTIFAGEAPLFFVSPKLTFPNKNKDVHFGVGGNLVLIPDGSSRYIAGSLFGITTFGNKDNNFTLGAGYAFSEDGFAQAPAIQIGGQFRLGKSFMIVSDHIVVFDNSDAFIGGTWTARYISSKVSIDIGVVAAYDSGALPVLGVGIKF